VKRFEEIKRQQEMRDENREPLSNKITKKTPSKDHIRKQQELQAELKQQIEEKEKRRKFEQEQERQKEI